MSFTAHCNEWGSEEFSWRKSGAEWTETWSRLAPLATVSHPPNQLSCTFLQNTQIHNRLVWKSLVNWYLTTGIVSYPGQAVTPLWLQGCGQRPNRPCRHDRSHPKIGLMSRGRAARSSVIAFTHSFIHMDRDWRNTETLLQTRMNK